MTTYKIIAEIDKYWLEMLGQMTRHQDGFVWCEVNETENN